MAQKRVIIQAGHVAPREPGFEGGTGTRGEQEFVTKVRAQLANLLRADGRFEVILAPGDIPDGIRVDAGLFLHADGSGNQSASGYSFGFPPYPVNKKLADYIAAEFNKIPGHPPHHTDNYTRDLSGYYGYSRVNTLGPEVLVEHGFLTNPREAAWLNAHIGELARAEYLALLRYFKMKPQGPPKARKWAYKVEEASGEKFGKTNYPALTVTRIAKRLKEGERIILERL